MINNIKNKKVRNFVKWLYRCTPDRIIYSIHYFVRHKRLMNWWRPKGYNQKIQWLKLHYRNPLQTVCADKLRVRDYVSSKIGDSYLNELYGAYQSVDDINFDELPKKFVLKANHGTGMNIICRDKEQLPLKSSKDLMKTWLNTNLYHNIKEWQYKDIKPMIIAEKLIEGMDTFLDYRFYCYKGKPLFVRVMADKLSSNVRENIYTIDWEKIQGTTKFPPIEEPLSQPENYETMVDIARKLAGDFPHVRVDLYNISGKILFGELTFHTGNGFTIFKQKKFESLLGDPIVLERYSAKTRKKQFPPSF